MKKTIGALVCGLLLMGTVCRSETVNEGTFYISVSQSEFISEVAQSRGMMGDILRQFQADGLSGGITLINDHTARVWASADGFTAEAYVVNTGGGSDASGSGSQGGRANPASSARIAVNKIIRQQIFVQAEPEPSQAAPGQPASGVPAQPEQKRKPLDMPALGRLTSGSADVFYNAWKFDDVDGSTFGINPSVKFGDKDQFTFTLPLQFIDPSEGDSAFGIGLDGAWRHSFEGEWNKWAAGLHAYVLGDFGGSDNITTFGGGPFLSYQWRLNKQWIVSSGGLLEFTEPSKGDSDIELAPGVNVGYNFSDHMALNGYVLYFWGLKSGDDSYADLGADMQWIAGTWSFSFGLKTSQGIDHGSSTEVYLGSNWRF